MKADHHICPIWVGYFLNNPLRRLYQSPKRILTPYVKEGMSVLDVGCAMGFFTLPLAKMVGPTGTVIAVDVQSGMIDGLVKRARKAGLSDRIIFHTCSPDTLDLSGYDEKIDFALAFAVVHEVPDRDHLLLELWKLLKPDGKLLIAEPKGHVAAEEFDATLSTAVNGGFDLMSYLRIPRSYATVLCKKPSAVHEGGKVVNV